jgi:hypothetical protein
MKPLSRVCMPVEVKAQFLSGLAEIFNSFQSA